MGYDAKSTKRSFSLWSLGPVLGHRPPDYPVLCCCLWIGLRYCCYSPCGTDTTTNCRPQAMVMLAYTTTHLFSLQHISPIAKPTVEGYKFKSIMTVMYHPPLLFANTAPHDNNILIGYPKGSPLATVNRFTPNITTLPRL